MRAPELFDLTGSAAIVTGGGSGLGLQMAEALGECGARVVLCARNEKRCVEAARALCASGVEAIGLRCDVRDPGEVQAVVDRTLAEHGRIDVLVNSAGTSWGAPAAEVPLAAWQKVIDVNLTGTFLFSQAVGKAMIAGGAGGSIVNISSIAASRGLEPEAMDAVPYSASKGGVESLTIDLAVKWARHGIRVNAIAPGWFDTEISATTLEKSGELFAQKLPLRRLGGPDDLKGAVVYFASAAASYTTGQVLSVDGGLLASW